MMDKVWIVTFDGYWDGYGSFIYLLGVYDGEGKAFSARERFIKEQDVAEYQVSINSVEINNTLEVVKGPWAYTTDIYLGGYAE